MKEQAQRGVTIIQIILLVLIISFISIIGIRLAPPYFENAQISTALKEIAKDPEVRNYSTSDIREKLSRHFYINNIKNADAKSLKVEKTNGRTELILDYEVRVEVIGNVDAVLKFKNEVFAQ